MRSILLLAVVPILSRAPSSITVSGIHAAAASAVDMRADLKLLSEEDLFVLANPQQRVLDCGSDLGCVSERLRALDADLGLIAVVSEVDGVLIDLRLIQTSDGRLIASEGSTYTPSEGSIIDAISARIARLLEEAGHQRAGRLIVTVSPPEARLWIDGREREREILLEPGEHLLLASHEGHADAEQRVSVAAGETVKASVVLEKSESILSAWWLWTAIGAAVAAGVATAVVVATRPDAIYCTGRGSDPACD